jgi:hypothetical protein
MLPTVGAVAGERGMEWLGPSGGRRLNTGHSCDDIRCGKAAGESDQEGATWLRRSGEESRPDHLIALCVCRMRISF